MRPIELLTGLAVGTSFNIAAQHIVEGDAPFGIALGLSTCVVVTIVGLLLTRVSR